MKQWFADVAEDGSDEYPYAAFIQVTGAVHQLDGLWFSSEEDCERFIKEEVEGAIYHP